MPTPTWGHTNHGRSKEEQFMNGETEKLRSKQEQGTRNPIGSVDTADTKGNSLPIRESQNKHPQNNPPQDFSKKNQPQGIDSQQQGQQKTEDADRKSTRLNSSHLVSRM